MLKRILTAPIRWYRRWLSPLKRRPSCRYLPTCSEYAIEAIERKGPARGALLAVARVLRCNPLFHGGYHPVTGRVAPSGGSRRSTDDSNPEGH